MNRWFFNGRHIWKVLVIQDRKRLPGRFFARLAGSVLSRLMP